jgi:inorganic pyrophosphatase/exopolyphosphatase
LYKTGRKLDLPESEFFFALSERSIFDFDAGTVDKRVLRKELDVDHHRLTSFNTDIPILFWNNPLGSTSTLVALSYKQYGIAIGRPIAGLLMAGLISDTLNLTSPTATPIDANVLKELSRIVGIEPTKLAEEIFAVGSPLLTLGPDEVILADCKDYEEDGRKFSVSQIEELGYSHFYEKEGELLKALEAYRSRQESYSISTWPTSESFPDLDSRQPMMANDC